MTVQIGAITVCSPGFSRITLDAVHEVRDFPLPRLVSPVILA
jgi:hypothetical protein